MRCFTRLKNVFLIVCCAVVLFTVPAFAVVRLDSEPPTFAPYRGGYWFSGADATLGRIMVYVSANDGWTLDENGMLFRYVNSSASGMIYTENGEEYQFSCSAFSTPRYRSTSSSYQYTDLFIAPTRGNILIDNEFASVYDLQTSCSVFACFMLGMLLVIKLVKRG